MACMLNDCKYNKIKTLYQLSCLAWFIKKHALQNAKDDKDTESIQILETIQKNCEKGIEALDKLLCGGDAK